MNVSLSDLNLIVPAGASMNLLDTKHFSYNYDQLQKSATSGSLFIKGDKIKLREKSPPVNKQIKLAVSKDFRIGKKRSLVEIKEKRYEELEISDEKFVEEFADVNINKK